MCFNKKNKNKKTPPPHFLAAQFQCSKYLGNVGMNGVQHRWWTSSTDNSGVTIATPMEPILGDSLF